MSWRDENPYFNWFYLKPPLIFSSKLFPSVLALNYLLIYGPIARKLYRGLFPKSIFQSTSTAQNELNIVSLYLWLYEKPRRPPKFPFQFLSKLNSTNKKKMTVFDSPK